MKIKGKFDVRKTKDQFIFESKQIHGDLYDYTLVEYLSNKVKVNIVCEKHGSFEKTPKAHIQLKQGCPKCSIELKKINNKISFEKFLKLAKEKHNNLYEYEEYEYYGKSGLIKVICKKHGKYKIKPKSHLKYSCKSCYYDIIGSSLRKTNEKFILESFEIHGNNYDYSFVDYKNNRSKINIICKKCNKSFYITPKNHLMGGGCSFCEKSKGERIIEKYLIDNNIKYKSQYMFNDCRNILPLKFDFYLEDFNLCIEFDGVQHYDENSIYWSENAKRNDIIKDTYCKKNSIPLIRIPYYQLKNINTFLNRILIDMNIISINKKRELFIENAKKIWGEKYDYSLVKYINEEVPVIIMYKGLKYNQKPKDHLWGIKCENSNNKRMSNENFIFKSKQIWGDRFDYSECEYLGTNVKVKLFDKKTKNWIYQIPKSHLKGFSVKKNSEDDFLEKVNYVHEFKYKYNFDYKNLNSKLTYNCPLHGITTTKCYSHLYGGSCVKCDEYKLNVRVSRFLNKCGVSFSKQHHFKDCIDKFTLPFDFYIYSCNIIIEYDGMHKYKSEQYGLTDIELKKIRYRDKIKEDYCEENFINLIRIKYTELDKIEEILYPYFKNFMNYPLAK